MLSADNIDTARLSASGSTLCWSVPRAAIRAARTVPEKVEAAVSIDHQIGEDRLGQARIVDADLMIFASRFLGGLGPSSAEFDIAGVEAEGRSAFAFAVHRLEGGLGIKGEGLDRTREEAVLGVRESADRCHCHISICFELQVASDAFLMAIERPAAQCPTPTRGPYCAPRNGVGP